MARQMHNPLSGTVLLNSPAQEVLTTVFGLFLAGELEQLFHLLGAMPSC